MTLKCDRNLIITLNYKTGYLDPQTSKTGAIQLPGRFWEVVLLTWRLHGNIDQVFVTRGVDVAST